MEMSEFFTMNDFCGIDDERLPPSRRIACAKRANEVIKERSQVVYGYNRHGCWSMDSQPAMAGVDTHTALLICVTPIARDTPEKIFNELAEYKFEHNVGEKFRELVDRARALKERK